MCGFHQLVLRHSPFVSQSGFITVEVGIDPCECGNVSFLTGEELLPSAFLTLILSQLLKEAGDKERL